MRVLCTLCQRELCSLREGKYHLERIHHMQPPLRDWSQWLRRQTETSAAASTSSSLTIAEASEAYRRSYTRTGQMRTSNWNAEPSGRNIRRTTPPRRSESSRSSAPSTLQSQELSTSLRSELTQLLDSMMAPLAQWIPKPKSTAPDPTAVRAGLLVHKLPCTSGHADNCIHRRQFRAWLWTLSREGRLNFLPLFDEWMTLTNRLQCKMMPSEMLCKWRTRLLQTAAGIGGPATKIAV